MKLSEHQLSIVEHLDTFRSKTSLQYKDSARLEDNYDEDDFG